MDDDKKEKLFLEYLKKEFSKNILEIHKSETQLRVEFLQFKDFKEKMDTPAKGFILLLANRELDYEVSFYILEKDAAFLSKKGQDVDMVFSNLLKIENTSSARLFSKSKSGSQNNDFQSLSSLKCIRKVPDEFSDEIFWIADRGKIVSIQSNSFSFYYIIKEDSYHKINPLILEGGVITNAPEVISQKILISNPYEFVLGRYLIPFTGHTKQYELGIKIQEVIHFNSLSINQKIGLAYKYKIEFKNSSFINYFFISLNSQAEVKSYSPALLEIFTNLTEKNREFLTTRLPGIKQDVLLGVDIADLMGKKLTLFRADLRISKNHLSLYILTEPDFLFALMDTLMDDFSKKEYKKSNHIPSLVFGLNTFLLHKEKDNYAEFSYPTTEITTKIDEVKKFLLIARFINLIDNRDLMVLVQNYFIQNYKTTDLVSLFIYSVLNPSTNTKKNYVLQEFDEKRFISFLVGVHIEEFEFQKTKEQKSIEFMYDQNLRFFLELNQALKSDKMVLSAKARHVFYDIFMKYYMDSKSAELDSLGNLTDYIKDVRGFHKKFASDMVSELSKEVVCISYIDNREAVDFLTTFMSKNRKEQIMEDYQYYKKQFKDNKIDILDVYDARKILFQKYKDLKQALIDEGMV